MIDSFDIFLITKKEENNNLTLYIKSNIINIDGKFVFMPSD